jgi:ribose-phosphate pyrophosphokinase
MGVNKIVTVDLHAIGTTGVTSPKMSFEDYEAGFVGINWFMENLKEKDNLCVVAPDAGAIKRAKKFHGNFEKLGLDSVGLALMHKERRKANEVAEMQVIGDVRGKDCIIVDDMVDTAGTLCKAA